MPLATAFAVASLATAVSETPAGAANAYLCGTYWVVEVGALKKGEDAPPEDGSRTLRFIYDTGASNTSVDPDSLERVFGNRISSGTTVTIRNAVSGSARYDKLPAKVRELDHIFTALGHPVDGILGHSGFGPYLVTLDYAGEEIRLAKGSLPKPDGETIFTTRGPDPRPWLIVDFDGDAEKVLIDSGSGDAFSLNDVASRRIEAPPAPIGSSVRIDRIEINTAARLSGEARFGRYRFQKPVLETVPRTQLMGGDAMRHFTVTYDNRRRRVRFERAASGPIVSPPRYEFGASLKPVRGSFEVLDVFDDAPAADAGLRKGDVITRLNGKPIAERGCPRTDGPEAPGNVAATILRDGVELAITIEFDEPLVH